MKQRNFHIHREARKKYSFPKGMFSTTGNVVFADYSAAKEFAGKMNSKFAQDGANRYVNPGEIYAIGLIGEIMHYVFYRYTKEIDPSFLSRAHETACENVGKGAFDETIESFITEFPSISVEGGVQFNEFEEMILLKIFNENQALNHFRELFDDSFLIKETKYLSVFSSVEQSSKLQKTISTKDGGLSLIEFLRAPFKASPDSLSGQLIYMKENWGLEFLKDFSIRILTSTDIMREESKPFFGPDGSPKGEIITKESLLGPLGEGVSHDIETVGFSTDSSWMPEVVMVAKNVFVWLDQLSKKYAANITKLDEIPQDEFKILAEQGFTALWLIGLWERSHASKRIKQIMGNHDAVASAYSLYDYSIAKELGGQSAFENFKGKAWSYGIRVASDMVPNHMAIDSKWVYEHPDWFLSLNEPPFPNYSYNGENLSNNSDIEIFIEDHYYNKSDAAVTFKRVDKKSGETRYIYHGNDGTCMPWNDTAQLNYLSKEVREHVIKTIIAIAKDFPLIRFDAAMTLAKRHYHRLWFPEPGSGGDIASRAEQGMSRKEFDRHFPKEFWREVVDRVAEEVPGTLLLAEAFWLMEGYFVRTLGMHRVYNSAFMNFMKDEENAKYRESIKNVLEFDPHILERHVNFLNNPDEETAVKQFGTGDKYFGVTLSMVTMPGLPMFGHGQIEGFSEKYGMEYKRAYWNEAVNWDLVHRHEREIFPLMRLRGLFAHVDHFNFFDFYLADGNVNEDVFAYSNGYKGKKVLVFYHNRYSDTEGWIKTSVNYLDKKTGMLARKELHDALEISGKEGHYLKFKDLITGLQYIVSCKEIYERGFFIKLNAYKYFVFSDFEEVVDSLESPWGKLCNTLQKSGVVNLDLELDKIRFRSLHDSFREVVGVEIFEKLVKANSKKEASSISKLYSALLVKYQKFIDELCSLKKGELCDKVAELFISDLKIVLNFSSDKLEQYDLEADSYLKKILSYDKHRLYTVFGFTVVAKLFLIQKGKEKGADSLDLMLKYRLDYVFKELLEASGLSSWHATMVSRYIRAFVYYQDWWKCHDSPDFLTLLMEEVFKDSNMHSILQINSYEGKKWFNKEAFEHFLTGLFIVAVLNIEGNVVSDAEKVAEFKKRYHLIKSLIDVAEKAGYAVDDFLLQGFNSGGF
ncbi:MAG: alpha-amylase family glycosyl hydrolase [bacterium]